MGFEKGGYRKPPQFIIDAAMKEDPSVLRRIQEKALETKRLKRAQQKELAEAATKSAEDARLEAERAKWAFLKDPQVVKDAARHAAFIDLREEDE